MDLMDYGRNCFEIAFLAQPAHFFGGEGKKS